MNLAEQRCGDWASTGCTLSMERKITEELFSLWWEWWLGSLWTSASDIHNIVRCLQKHSSSSKLRHKDFVLLPRKHMQLLKIANFVHTQAIHDMINLSQIFLHVTVFTAISPMPAFSPFSPAAQEPASVCFDGFHVGVKRFHTLNKYKAMIMTCVTC